MPKNVHLLFSKDILVGTAGWAFVLTRWILTFIQNIPTCPKTITQNYTVEIYYKAKTKTLKKPPNLRFGQMFASNWINAVYGVSIC